MKSQPRLPHGRPLLTNSHLLRASPPNHQFRNPRSPPHARSLCIRHPMMRFSIVFLSFYCLGHSSSIKANPRSQDLSSCQTQLYNYILIWGGCHRANQEKLQKPNDAAREHPPLLQGTPPASLCVEGDRTPTFVGRYTMADARAQVI